MTNEKRRPGTNPEAAATGELSVSDPDDLARATAVLSVAWLRGSAEALRTAAAADEAVTLCPRHDVKMIAAIMVNLARRIEADDCATGGRCG